MRLRGIRNQFILVIVYQVHVIATKTMANYCNSIIAAVFGVAEMKYDTNLDGNVRGKVRV